MAKNGPLKLVGGKSYLKNDIQRLAPPHTLRLYACAGGWSEGWDWHVEGTGEVVNDVDGHLVNFYEVLAEPKLRKELVERLRLTPFSHPQWRKSREFLATRIPKEVTKVQRAYHFFVMTRQSMLGAGDSFAPVSHSRVRRGILEQVSAYLSAIDGLAEAGARLQEVLFLSEVCWTLVKKYDKKGVFIYLDPPYHPSVRQPGLYRHEMTEEQHDLLLEALGKLKNAKFMLSGYRCKAYDAAAKRYGWRRVDIPKKNSSSKKKEKETKLESLWANYDME